MKSLSIVPRMRLLLAVLLLLGLLMIGQHFSLAIYKVGVLVVLAAVVLGFTFNNIGEDRSAKRVIVPLIVTWFIVAFIFGLAYILAPVLTQIGS